MFSLLAFLIDAFLFVSISKIATEPLKRLIKKRKIYVSVTQIDQTRTTSISGELCENNQKSAIVHGPYVRTAMEKGDRYDDGKGTR